ncbi:MAG: hypothetical protein GXO42_01125 [bacterium]|nr:hypothetical protein [bacterium]
MKYLFVLRGEFPDYIRLALDTETPEVKRRVKSKYKKTKIIIASTSYTHFRAAVLSVLHLLQMLERVSAVLEDERARASAASNPVHGCGEPAQDARTKKEGN